MVNLHKFRDFPWLFWGLRHLIKDYPQGKSFREIIRAEQLCKWATRPYRVMGVLLVVVVHYLLSLALSKLLV